MKGKLFFAMFAGAAILLAGLSSAARAQTVNPPIFFDGFLFDNGGQPADNFNLFFQWDVTNGSVDLIGGNVPGADDPAAGGRYVDLGGSTNDPGTFSTKTAQPLMPGVIYNLSFRYNSVDGTQNTATASIGGQTFTVSTASTTFQQFSRNFSVPAATMTPLVFQDLGATSDGIGIDDVQLALAIVSAGEVSVGGRVTTSAGRGVAKARVSLTSADGSVRFALTNPFGYYRFAEVPAGETYILTARDKRYSFNAPTRAVTANEDETNVNFVANSGEGGR